MNILQEDYPELMWNGKEELPVVLNFGAGVDSTAILVKMVEENHRLDCVIFSDTGAERPDIYAHIDRVERWLFKKKGMRITKVSAKMKELFTDRKKVFWDLEEHCINLRTMPSIAYGYKSCSLKWKGELIDKYCEMEFGNYIKTIGYDSSEIDRALKGAESAKNNSKGNYKLYFPLIDWKINRTECKNLASKIGFCTAKSACYFCPSMPKSSVIELSKHYPDLFEKAVKIETEALKHDKEKYEDALKKAVEVFGVRWFTVNKKEFKERGMKYPPNLSVKGLGRSWNWKELVDSYSPDLPFIDENGADSGCGCLDF